MRNYGSLFLPLLMVFLAQCKSKKPVAVAQPPARIPLSYVDLYYSAELSYQSGDYKTADSLFRKCVALKHLPSPAYFRLACMEQSKGNLAAALALTAKAEAADTANHHYHLYAAELHKQSGSQEKAGDIYFAQAAKSKRGWTLYLDAIKCYQSARKWNKVLAVCNHAETKFGLLEALGENRSNAWQALGNYTAAAGEWERLVKKYPDRRSYRMRLAALLNQGGNANRASAIYDSLYIENPNDGSLLAIICQFRLKKDQFSQLEVLKKLALSNTTQFNQKWNCIGVALSISELYDSMEPVLSGLQKMHPTSKQAIDALADWCGMHGQHVRAAKLYKNSLIISNADFTVWEKYLNVLSLTCDFNAMLGDADSLAEMYPLDGRAYAYKALALHLLNRNEESLQTLKTAMNFATGSEVQALIGSMKVRVLLSSGKKAEAEKEIEIMEKSGTDYEGLKLCKAEWQITTGQLENAKATLGEVDNKMKMNEQNGLWYCILKLKMKQIPAENKKLNLEQYFPESPYWLDAVADYLQPAGECNQAVALWKKAGNCASYAFKAEIRNKIYRCENR